MLVYPYIKTNQPILYKTFFNALTNDKVAQAYLLVGGNGIPLKQIASFLGKSLLCDHPTPFADEECNSCRRIDNGNNPDFLLINGEEESIKKEHIDSLISAFSATAFGPKGIKVYIINLVENMTTEAVNGLLKFLEEPPANTYAFLTSQNINKVLPTIISRCQTINLLFTPRNKILEECEHMEIPQKDAELLSFFYNEPNLIKEKLEDDNYLKIKEAFEHTLDGLDTGKEYARYKVETNVLPLLNKKPLLRNYFDLMIFLFEDLLSLRQGSAIKLNSYATIIKSLEENLNHIEDSILKIMLLKQEIELNINPTLLLFKLISIITEE